MDSRGVVDSSSTAAGVGKEHGLGIVASTSAGLGGEEHWGLPAEVDWGWEHRQSPTPTENMNSERAVPNPSNSAPTAGNVEGDQLTNQPAQPVAAAVIPLSRNTKKRKPNASGTRQTSAAWDHFVKLPDTEIPTAECKYCKKRFYCDSRQHGTGNLLHHTPKCPKFPYAVSADPRQRVLTVAQNRNGEGSSLVATSQRFNEQACRKAVAFFVVLDEQPFSVVEGEGFKLLCKQLQPQFSARTRCTVAKDCFELYQNEKARLKALFRSNSSKVALTTDCWTSIQNLNYLTLTAHFIDSEWKYQKRILSFSVIPNHRGDTIGRHVEEVLRQWGLRNVSTLTVDNASSNDTAVAYLRKKFNNMGGLVCEGKFFHVRCCAHILNLVVSDGLKELNTSISSIRNAVRYVRSSPQRMAKFKECIEIANICSQKLVCLDVSTRWNSTYLMLEAAEKYQAAFEKLEFEDAIFAAEAPASDDWDNARCFIKFLKIFYESTKVFSASSQITIHSAFHQLAIICGELNQSILSPSSILSTMGMGMKRKYDKYWGSILNINQLLYFGVTLDPRYKLSYVEWSFKEMYSPEQFEKLSTSVKENLSELYNCYAVAFAQQNQHGQSSRGQSSSSTQAKHSSPAEVPTVMARADAYRKHLKEKNAIEQKNELERYLAEGCVALDSKFDLLVWWKQNSSRFPILSTLARDVLATPVSTVASESVFSTSGRVLDTFRSSLSPEMAEGLICAQNWLKPFLQQFKELNIFEEFENSEKIVSEFQQRAAAAGGVGPSSQPMNIG